MPRLIFMFIHWVISNHGKQIFSHVINQIIKVNKKNEDIKNTSLVNDFCTNVLKQSIDAIGDEELDMISKSIEQAIIKLSNNKQIFNEVLATNGANHTADIIKESISKSKENNKIQKITINKKNIKNNLDQK